MSCVGVLNSQLSGAPEKVVLGSNQLRRGSRSDPAGQSQPRSWHPLPPPATLHAGRDRRVLSLRPCFSSENCQQSHPSGITGRIGVIPLLHGAPWSMKSWGASARRSSWLVALAGICKRTAQPRVSRAMGWDAFPSGYRASGCPVLAGAETPRHVPSGSLLREFWSCPCTGRAAGSREMMGPCPLSLRSPALQGELML